MFGNYRCELNVKYIGSVSHGLCKNDSFSFNNFITFFLEGRMDGKHNSAVLWLSYSSLDLAYSHGQGPPPFFRCFALLEYRRNGFVL